MKRRVVIFVAGWAFAAGIIIASFLPKNSLFLGFYYFLAAGLFLIIAAFFWQIKTRRAIFFWAACLFLGIWRLSISLPIDSPDKIFYYNGQSAEFIGLVAAEPTNKPKSQKLEIRSLEIKSPQTRRMPSGSEAGSVWGEVSGKVLVIASPYPKYDYGEILKIKCKLESPGVIEDFDYGKYLAAQGIYSACSFPKVSVLDKKDLPPEIYARAKKFSRFFWFSSGLYKAREKLGGQVDNGLTEPEAGLLKAFLFNNPTVPDDLNDSFRKSGLSHIVAISGSHISELVGIVFFCLLFLGINRRTAFWFCWPIILSYVAMVGSPASATRAGVMGCLVLSAMYFGRLSRLDYSLVLSGVVMLLFNPMLIIADAGFQLSFLAVLGMIYLYPIFDKWLARFYEEKSLPLTKGELEGVKTKFPLARGVDAEGGRGVLKEVISNIRFVFTRNEYFKKIFKLTCQAFALTIAAQIFTAPILIFGFHQISLVAPLANLFVLWAAPLIMISAFISIGLSFIFPPGAIYFFLPVGFLLKYLIIVAEISASLPLAYWKF